MANYNVKDYDDHDQFGIDRDGSYDHTAKRLALSIEELDKLIEGKFVLDLGSGPALFAKRCYIKEVKDSSYKGPKKVESMNIRINDPKYVDSYKHRDGDLKFSKINIQTESFHIPILGTEGVMDDDIKNAIERAEDNFSSLDWNDLIKLPLNIYDVIISHNGFPYYSDLDAEFIVQDNKWFKSKITVSDKDLGVFKGIGHVLKPGGIAYLTPNHKLNIEKWNNSDSNDKQEIIDTLISVGCTFEFVNNQGKDLIVIRKS
ncbi:MAG: hypothetical protein ACMG57_04010 [Candidatus Dojkabacteria bacterium]